MAPPLRYFMPCAVPRITFALKFLKLPEGIHQPHRECGGTFAIFDNRRLPWRAYYSIELSEPEPMRLPLTAPLRHGLAVVAIVWATHLAAAEPPQPTPEAIALDETVQLLKDEVLELNRTVQQLEDDYAYPPQTAVSVFIGSEPIAAFLEQVVVRVDGNEPVLYSYTPREARGLLKKGLHRVLRFNVEPGLHKLTVDFRAAPFSPDPKKPLPANTAPTQARAEVSFRKGEREVELLAQFTGTSAKLTPYPSYKAGSRDDPRVRAADFLNNDERHFAAVLTLLQLRKEQQNAKLPADHLWRLAESYLAFGMRSKAEAIYRELAVTTTDHVTLARARVRLGQFLYQRGFLDESTATLMRMRDKLPEPSILLWQDWLSRTLMAQGRYGDAQEVLTEMKNGDKQSPYTRYNLAVALLNDGDVKQGVSILDKLGKMSADNTELLALRDKANLTLGYHFLQKQQGATAAPIFARVRLNGPYSNRALLGLGWAELAPKGQRQRKTEIADEPEEKNPLAGLATLGVLMNPARIEKDPYKLAGIQSFSRKGQSSKEENQLRRALVPWAELINRDPMDPAVLEGMLAIPFALDRIGAHQSAQEYYEKAVALLEASRSRIDDANGYIKEGRMVEAIVRRDIDSEAGWDWRLRDLPDAPETFYLQSVIAENRFQEALKNYRDVRFMGRNLDGVRQRLDALDALYAANAPRDVSPEVLIERARQGRKPEKAKIQLKLKMDVLLTVPYASPETTEAQVPLALKLADTPPRFTGPREVSAELRRQLDDLRPRVAAAGGMQSDVLRAIANKELDGQKKVFDHYLIESRFALARIYEGRVKEVGEAKAAKEKAEAEAEAKKGIFSRLFSRKKADEASNKAAKEAVK